MIEFEYENEIPEDLLQVGGVTIVSVLNEDGSSGFAYRTEGDLDRATLLGLLELVKHDILMEEFLD